jgi:small GTP-binding protein
MQIWDTAGEEKFRSVTPMYYKNASAVILMYDSTKHASFNSLERWLDDIEKFRSEDNQVIAIAAGKSDLVSSQEVPPSEAAAFAESQEALFAETSAKENTGIRELFVQVAAKLYQSYKSKSSFIVSIFLCALNSKRFS